MLRAFHSAALDRIAVGLSALCVLHCVLSVALVAMLSGVSTAFTDPVIHRLGLAGAVVLAAAALGLGYRHHRAVRPLVFGMGGIAIMALGLVAPHGWAEVALTVAGVSLLAVAHLMNGRLRA